jgi:protein SCO1
MLSKSRALIVTAFAIAMLGVGLAFAVSRWDVVTSSPSIGGPFTLNTSDGGTVTDKTYRGKWLIVYFGYTFCPDACPTTLTNISGALEQLGPLAARVQPIFISVDPKRDTPRVMAEYMKSFDPRIVGLTGTPEETAAAAAQYHVVYYASSNADDDDYVVDHSSLIYVMSPQGKFLGSVVGNTESGRLAEQMRQWIKEAS